ncbi:MAG: hypothetical protein QOJ89_2675, partial [bacterium]
GLKSAAWAQAAQASSAIIALAAGNGNRRRRFIDM